MTTYNKIKTQLESKGEIINDFRLSKGGQVLIIKSSDNLDKNIEKIREFIEG